MKRTGILTAVQHINQTQVKLVEDSLQDSTHSILKQKLKIQDVLMRTIFWFILTSIFIGFVYFGVPTLFLMILIIQTKCLDELVNLGLKALKCENIKWSKLTCWYFINVSTYYLYGDYLFRLLSISFKASSVIITLQNYHYFISYLFYMVGFVCFVITVDKVHFKNQYILFGYTHLVCFFIVKIISLVIYNLFEGVIWFVLPVVLVITNDTSAYIFGKLFGKTKLIHLSPKKTWEGFISAAISTLILGILLSSKLSEFPSLICSIDEMSSREAAAAICNPKDIFKLQTYELPMPFNFFAFEIQFKPFILHSIVLSLFAAFVAPFGGFLASGFKRCFDVKDFSETIPGHGGFLDRIDCMISIVSFTNVYIYSFIK